MIAGVWGAGAEGRSAAQALAREGADVLVVDESGRLRPDGLDPAARFFTGEAAVERLLETSIVIISPGVPRGHPFRARLDMARIPMTSLTDRWLISRGKATIGVTGTKGKSTTTTLIGLLLRAAGVDSQIGGNIGVPLADLRPDAEATIAELSSYQCASITVAPRIAVITSLYEDHLTWHGSKEAYWLDKARIAGPACEALVCDPETLTSLRSIDVGLPAHLVMPAEAVSSRVDVGSLPPVLQLGQNLHNLHLAVLAADLWLARPVSDDEIIQAATAFRPLPHRLERVAERAGTIWVDDTLSTVPESVVAASQAFPGDIVLIVGGEERGIRYDVLTDHLEARTPLPQVVAMPSNGDRIVSGYERSHPDLVHHAPTLEAAVLIAGAIARPGTTILLSPGAPSYDRFTNFEHKSAAFAEAIRTLDATTQS